MVLPPDARLLPAACITESLSGDFSQSVRTRPRARARTSKVPQVPDHPDVERVRGEPVRSLSRGEVVRADQLIWKPALHPDLCGHGRDRNNVGVLPPASVFSESVSSELPWCAGVWR